MFVVEAAETGGHHAAEAEVADRFALVGAGGGESMALPFTIPDDGILGGIDESDVPSVFLAPVLLMDAWWFPFLRAGGQWEERMKGSRCLPA